MCALKFLRLEDFLYDRQHGQTINLEPQGILFADVCLCLLEQTGWFLGLDLVDSYLLYSS